MHWVKNVSCLLLIFFLEAILSNAKFQQKMKIQHEKNQLELVRYDLNTFLWLINSNLDLNV